ALFPETVRGAGLHPRDRPLPVYARPYSAGTVSASVWLHGTGESGMGPGPTNCRGARMRKAIRMPPGRAGGQGSRLWPLTLPRSTRTGISFGGPVRRSKEALGMARERVEQTNVR